MRSLASEDQNKFVDNFEIRNDTQYSDDDDEDNLKTDEDAEFKRAILQLIFIDDV